MNKLNLAVFAFVVFLAACERPNSPDFKLEQRVQTPLVFEREYRFLGGSGALIDTTSTDFDSLFSIAGDGLVTLSREEELSFQNVNNVVPGISATSTQIDAVIGEINLDDFSSQSELGDATFDEVTGLNSSNFNQGDSISAGNKSGINIDLDTDYFVSATISSNGGSITITLRNDLGFDADGNPPSNDGLTVTLNSGTTALDTDSKDVPHGESRDFAFNISQGTQLTDLNIDIDAGWSTQNLQSEPDRLVVQDLQANNLEASEVEAVVSSQDFSSSGQSTIDDLEFEMTAADHYTELESGELHIHEIVNNLDVDIDQLVISFPGILSAPFGPSDSLVVRFEGSTAIPRNSQNQVEKTESLGGYRVYAQNNVIDYNLAGLTENVQQGVGSELRIINSADNVQATVDLENLEIAEGFGILKPRDIILNEDDPSNGTDQVDVFNDSEAEIISIGGLDVLSEKISGIEFANPILTLNYETNFGVPTEVFSTIAAINGKGEQIFLKGSPGSDHEVSDAEAPDVLKVNGSSAGGDRMIKFDTDTTWSGTITRSVVFDRDNSNLDEFFNILPSEIRFITDTEVNKNSVEGMVRSPVVFDPSFSIDLPLNIASSGSTFEDTLSANLSNLPGQKSKARLIEAFVRIGYRNNLPLRFNFDLIFLDDQNQPLTTVPLENGETIEIEAAPINEQTRYVEQTTEGEAVITLNRDQMSMINKTRNIRLRALFTTSNQENVRIRADDTIVLTIDIDVRIETSVN